MPEKSRSDTMSQERRFKLVVLGTTGVGKTCLTLRFVKGLYETESLPTIGAAYMTKKIVGDHTDFVYEIWDTAGQERYQAITPLYYRSAEAAVIVFDLTDTDSFEKAQHWLKRLRKERPDPSMPIALAANKSDATSERAVTAEAAREFADSVGLQCVIAPDLRQNAARCSDSHRKRRCLSRNP